MVYCSVVREALARPSGRLHLNAAYASLRYLKHHRATMGRPTGGDKRRELGITQAVLLQHPNEAYD